MSWSSYWYAVASGLARKIISRCAGVRVLRAKREAGRGMGEYLSSIADQQEEEDREDAQHEAELAQIQVPSVLLACPDPLLRDHLIKVAKEYYWDKMQRAREDIPEGLEGPLDQEDQAE